MLRARNDDWLVNRVEYVDPRRGSRYAKSSSQACELSKEQGTRLVRGLVVAGFWMLRDEKPANAEDGTIWIVEARRDNGYHVVLRHSAGIPAEFRNAAEAILQACGSAP
jgi:hypothetical protein